MSVSVCVCVRQSLYFLELLELGQGCHGTRKTMKWEVHFSREGKHWEFTQKIKS